MSVILVCISLGFKLDLDSIANQKTLKKNDVVSCLKTNRVENK